MDVNEIKIIVGVSLDNREFAKFMIGYMDTRSKFIEPMSFANDISKYYTNVLDNREDLNVKNIATNFEKSMNKQMIYSDIYIFLNENCDYDHHAIIGWVVAEVNLKKNNEQFEKLGFPQVYNPDNVDDSLIDTLKIFGIKKYNYDIFNLNDFTAKCT